MPDVFYRWLYLSRAFIDPCGSAPRDILEVSTQRNATLGVTGVLCFSGDHFAQLLEGEEGALAKLMESIRNDARHRVLREWPTEVARDPRWFPGWAMGYVYDERLETLVGDLASSEQSQSWRIDQLADLLFTRLELYRGQGLQTR